MNKNIQKRYIVGKSPSKMTPNDGLGDWRKYG